MAWRTAGGWFVRRSRTSTISMPYSLRAVSRNGWSPSSRRLVPQLLALPVHAPHLVVAVADLVGADEVVQLHLADGGAELAGEALAEDGLGALDAAHPADEAVHAAGVGDAPADVGVDGERLVDGVLLGVAGEQFRPRQVEILEAAVEALDRLDGPGEAEVESGLGVVGAVEDGDGPAELRQVDELGAVHGEDRQPAHDDGEDRDEEDKKDQFPAHGRNL